jgi:hypothetical protein
MLHTMACVKPLQWTQPIVAAKSQYSQEAWRDSHGWAMELLIGIL